MQAPGLKIPWAASEGLLSRSDRGVLAVLMSAAALSVEGGLARKGYILEGSRLEILSREVFLTKGPFHAESRMGSVNSWLRLAPGVKVAKDPKIASNYPHHHCCRFTLRPYIDITGNLQKRWLG